MGISLKLKKLEDFQAYPFGDHDKQKSFEEAINEYKGQEVWKAIALIPYLTIEGSDLDSLRNFIEVHINEFLIIKNSRSTFMRKLICFYDWKKYGWE